MGISGRQLQSVQAIVKTACTDYVCALLPLLLLLAGCGEKQAQVLQ